MQVRHFIMDYAIPLKGKVNRLSVSTWLVDVEDPTVSFVKRKWPLFAGTLTKFLH